MSQITASTPQVLRPLPGNRATTYDVGPKPSIFLISPHGMPLGHPIGTDPKHFHLIAPYTHDARQWSKMSRTDIYSGESFTVTTKSQELSERISPVHSYHDIVARYQTHPERKSQWPR